MKSKPTSLWITKFTSKIRKDDYFLGKFIAEYEALNNMSDLQLAKYLECSLDALNRLALCRMPDDIENQFQQDVRRISEFAECNTDRLISLIREINALKALRGKQSTHADPTLLLAARDRRVGKRNKHKTKKASKSSEEESS